VRTDRNARQKALANVGRAERPWYDKYSSFTVIKIITEKCFYTVVSSDFCLLSVYELFTIKFAMLFDSNLELGADLLKYSNTPVKTTHTMSFRRTF
jgi:hypothetical protein